MVIIHKIFSKLRLILAEQGMSMAKLKSKTDISRTTISKLYHNKSNGIQFDTLEELCKLLNCRPEDILSYEEIQIDYKVIDIWTDCEDILNDGNGRITNDVARWIIEAEILYEGEKNILELIVEVGFDYRNPDHIDIEIPDFYDETYEKLNELKYPYYIQEYIKEYLKPYLYYEIEQIVDYRVNFLNL
ncbi:helix-turn-helix domain-containing protein [Alkalibacillus haloalkaliphilus]|uniref:helix-turn-helix domain-containing protein n=1 Tax=Alkalibacillus haloalkaliphilus TaxID=94136 RepID=UPI0024823E7E|nr:helix-turn-helix transcriptional regulator [Alkalibacillus haloalkaliphilus]